MAPDYVQVLEACLDYLREELQLREKRLAEIEYAMVSPADELNLNEPKIPAPIKGVVTTFRIARLLVETGPLDDFKAID